MTENNSVVESLYSTLPAGENDLKDPEVAHLVINHNKVVGSNLVPGLVAVAEEFDTGVRMLFKVKEGSKIAKPVHLCFGMLPEDGLQEIILNVEIEDDAQVGILAHCTFPNAVNVTHRMNAEITVGNNSVYSYNEKHVHNLSGGINVVPNARVTVKEGARFKTDFELLKGRVGKIDIQYEAFCHAHSLLEMNARVNGIDEDDIKISEIGHLTGEGARGVLTTRIAVRNRARAEVYNRLSASAPFARGHVDCKEIVKDQGSATATPIVEVSHPKAHVTHEAAIGSVDNKQLETLMARGLDEDEASELIIQGLLSE